MSETEVPLPTRKARTRLVAAAVLSAVFAAGFLVGIAVDHVVLHRGSSWRERVAPKPEYLAERLQERLDLSNEQRVKVEGILKRHHARMNEVWNSARPAIKAEIDAANAEIEKLLNPTQRQKFEELKMRMRSRNGKSRGDTH